MADRSISYDFKANFSQFKAELASAKQSVSDFGDQLVAEQDVADSLTEQLDVVAETAAKIGVTAGAGFAIAVTAAANFEESMSHVEAATGETAAAMDDLRQAALDAGASTVFSATEAASAIENLAKAGVSTKDILDGALAGSLDLAAAGTIEVADAAEYIATALTQFALEGDKAAHVADLLAAGAGKAQGEVTDMALALDYVGVPAANLGVSIEEATGAIALLAKSGIVGEKAGTSLRGMLASLTSPSDVAKKKMAELGISVFDAEGKFIGLEGVAGQLQERMVSLTDAQRADALGRIFGNEQLQAANVLYREGAEGIATWTKAVDDAGFAQEQASTKLDNLKGDFEGLKGALETALIGTGDGQIGPLRRIVQTLGDVVNAYNDLPPTVQGAVGRVLGITAVLAGTVWFGAKAIGSVAAMKAQLIAMTTAAQRARLALVGMNALKFGGLLIALGALDQALEEVFKTRIKSTDLQRNLEALTRGKVSDDLQHLSEDIKILGENANGVAEPIQETIRLFGLIGDTPLDKAAKNIEDVDQALANMVEGGEAAKARTIFAELLEVIRQGGGSQVDAIKLFDAFGTALENTAASGDKAAEATSDLGEAAESADPEVQALADALKKARDDAGDALSSFRDLTAGVEDGKFSFKTWIIELEKAGRAVRESRINANKALDRGLDAGLVSDLQDMGTEGALQLEYLANASEKEIERTNEAIRNLERQTAKTTEQMAQDIVELSDVEAEPKVTLDTKPFYASANSVERRLDTLVRPREIKLRLALTNVGAAIGGLPGAIVGGVVGQADGGTVAGPRWPYGDKVLTALAPGEEVITNRNGEADRFRADRAAGRIPAYADGGTVDWGRVEAGRRSSYSGGSAGVGSGGLSSRDLDRLAAAVAAARPLYGDVRVQAHDYDDFRRQMFDDRRRAAAGGY